MSLRVIWQILWICWFLLMLFAATTPWSKVDGVGHWANVLWIPYVDFIWSEGVLSETAANLLLVVPLGYVTVRNLPPENRCPVLIATLAGLVCSTGTEAYQGFCYDSVPSTTS